MNNLVPCPMCGKLMNDRHSNGYRRIYCSNSCVAVSTNQKRMANQAIIDPIAVARLVSGDAPEVTTKGERLLATKYLTEFEYSIPQIAERLHVTERSVNRYRLQIKPWERRINA